MLSGTEVRRVNFFLPLLIAVTPQAARGRLRNGRGKSAETVCGKSCIPHPEPPPCKVFSASLGVILLSWRISNSQGKDLADSAWILLCWVTPFCFQIKRPIIACLWRFRQLLPYTLSVSHMRNSSSSTWKDELKWDGSWRLSCWITCSALPKWNQGSGCPGLPEQGKPCRGACARSQLQLRAGMHLTSGTGQPSPLLCELSVSHVLSNGCLPHLPFSAPSARAVPMLCCSPEQICSP